MIKSPNIAFHAVLFDLDGTLLDTTRAIYESLRHTVKHFTGIEPKEDELRPYMGLPLLEQFSSLIPGNESEALSVYVKHNTVLFPKYVKPYPKVRAVVNRLKTQGVQLAVVTSRRRESALMGLELAHISQLFDAHVFYEDTSLHKPHPAPVLRALELLEYTNAAMHQVPHDARILMVGDSPWDIKSAKSAQKKLLHSVHSISPLLGCTSAPTIKTAGVTYGAYSKKALEVEKPDYILDKISQVLALCKIEF